MPMRITAVKKMGYELREDGALGMRVNLGQETLVSAGPGRALLDRNSGFQPQSIEELTPTDEDYIYPVYRAISRCVMECYNLDLRRPGVLEASVPLADGQTVYTDHVADAENWVGAIDAAWWDDPLKTGTRFSTAGINARLKIDWRANPKIARGIMMEPPALHSVSMGLWFNWQKSHPDMPDQAFWEQLGREVDGRPVLIEVTKILKYDEISLVYQGADPEAKQVSAAAQAVNANQSKEGPRNIHAAEPPAAAIHTPAAGAATPLDRGDLQFPGGEQMEERLKRLMALLGATSQEAALDIVLQRHEAVIEAEKYLPLAIELQAAGLKPEEIKPVVEAGQAYRKHLQEDLGKYAALALCKPDQKLPEGFVEAQAGLPVAQLERNVALYRGMVEEKFPLTCQDCGGTNVQGRSSVAAVPQDEATPKKKQVDTSKLHQR